MIWINGANFVEGKQAGLLRKNWARALPNSRYVDWGAPIINRDFQVPVEGQESPWEGAAFVFGYNTTQVSSPPTSFPALLAWAKAHPGHFSYPAPPDFTGAAFVRQVIQRLGGVSQGLRYLKELKPYQYEHGRVFPTSIDELDQLFANNQVAFDMSYNANFLDLAVKTDKFPSTVRPFLIGGGALENTSYVTIPANAADTAGAEVVANLLLSPKLQADLANPAILGMPSVLDGSKLPAASAVSREHSTATDPYLLASLGEPLTELPASQDEPIEKAWTRMVLR
ncbi:MAG: extracellular solute-binding protein [Solirubrobacterales bacterium]|nr:extracellular solute-binding protein [Solirubrobacterales bacterium]